MDRVGSDGKSDFDSRPVCRSNTPPGILPQTCSDIEETRLLN
jgi:hypothetical protein